MLDYIIKQPIPYSQRFFDDTNIMNLFYSLLL
jgi:hypothetical protein